MKFTDQQRKRLEFLAKEIRRVAPLARRLDWIEVAYDIETALDGKEISKFYKNAEDLIMEARGCFLHSGLEIPYE